MKPVQFTAKPGGDGECFCFEEVPVDEMKAILGTANYQAMLDDENEMRQEMAEITGKPCESLEKLRTLTITDVLAAAGLDCLDSEIYNKRYRFTLTIEPLE
jgi:hypothetical protein